MTQFKQTNVYIEYDEAYNKVENPITKQTVYKGEPSAIARQWERDVLSILEDLYLHSQVSRQLFNALFLAGANPVTGNHDRRLVIKPYTPQHEKGNGVCNALASPKSNSADSPETFDGTGKGKGDGPGSSCTVYYDRSRWCAGARCGPAPGQAGSSPDEILMHEMLHGLRQLVGQMDRSKLGQGYDDMEEFYAILLTNIYMSERGRKLLRKNHQDFTPLEWDRAGSKEFLVNGNHLRWVNWLITHGAVFVRKVGDVKAPFNPIQAYLADTKYYNMLLEALATTPTTK